MISMVQLGRSFFVLLLFLNSCKKEERKNMQEKKIEDTSSLLLNIRKEEGIIYRKLNLFELKGEELYIKDTVNKDSLVYYVKDDKDKKTVYSIGNKDYKISYYYKRPLGYISTEIYFDNETSIHEREVTIISENLVKKFHYIIQGNNEYLSEIDFIYRRGKESHYELSKYDREVYYDYLNILTEKNIPTSFK